MKHDPKEFEVPETTYVRDIDDRVFQGIIAQILTKIPGISLVEGNVLDNLLGRPEGIKGIHTEQDAKNHSVSVKVEVKIAYGISIPEKAEEIQNLVVQEISKMTALHVSEVHVIFKGLATPAKPSAKPTTKQITKTSSDDSTVTEDS